LQASERGRRAEQSGHEVERSARGGPEVGVGRGGGRAVRRWLRPRRGGGRTVRRWLRPRRGVRGGGWGWGGFEIHAGILRRRERCWISTSELIANSYIEHAS
jgi:hypothetical protein